METKFVNFNGLEFPGYLNFGILDEKSLKLDGDTAIAEYLLDHTGDLVHRVKWGPGCCELETFFEGERTMQTRYSKCNLKEVLCNEYIVNHRFYESNLFLKIIGVVKALENLHVEIEKPAREEWTMSFYPAGKLFTFRIPYGPTITKIKEFMVKNVGSDWLGAMTFHEGKFLSYSKGSGLVKEQQLVAEFPVPLAYIVKAANIIIQSGVLTQGPHKVVLQEAYDAQRTEMLSSIGKEISYAMCFRDFPPEKQGMIDKEFMEAIGRSK